jgi:hypothetical protein
VTRWLPAQKRSATVRRMTHNTTVTFKRRIDFGLFKIEAGEHGQLISEPTHRLHAGHSVAVHVKGFPPVSVQIGRDVKVLRSRTDVGTIVSHRVARETGATITVERTGDGSWIEQEAGWMTLCLNHSTCVLHSTRSTAMRFAATPSEWCAECRDIVTGKSPMITSGLVK